MKVFVSYKHFVIAPSMCTAGEELLCQQILQWSVNIKMLNPKILWRPWHMKVWAKSFDLCWVRSNPCGTHNVTQILHFFPEQGTFLGVQLQIGTLQSLKYSKICWSNVWPGTRILSRYSSAIGAGRPANTCSTRRSKVTEALHKPKGRALNCHKPVPVEKGVFFL